MFSNNRVNIHTITHNTPRKYRIGELPDIQTLRLPGLLGPLSQLAAADSSTAAAALSAVASGVAAAAAATGAGGRASSGGEAVGGGYGEGVVLGRACVVLDIHMQRRAAAGAAAARRRVPANLGCLLQVAAVELRHTTCLESSVRSATSGLLALMTLEAL